MRHKATQTRSRLETGEAKLEESDGSEPDGGDLQRTAMKNRYANQRKGKQNEFNGIPSTAGALPAAWIAEKLVMAAPALRGGPTSALTCLTARRSEDTHGNSTQDLETADMRRTQGLQSPFVYCPHDV